MKLGTPVYDRGMKVILLAAAFSLWIGEAVAQVDGPRTTSSFDQGWVYKADDGAEFETSSFNDGQWTHIDLPHDWSIAQAYDEHSPAGGAGAFLPTGVVWYRKHFTA